jgi:hypothetical protein
MSVAKESLPITETPAEASVLLLQEDDMSETDAFLKAEGGGLDADEEAGPADAEDIGPPRAAPLPASIIVREWRQLCVVTAY